MHLRTLIYILLYLSVLPFHTSALWSTAFWARKPLLASSQLHTQPSICQNRGTLRPILSSYNSSWRWSVATAAGSALRTSISLPRHMAMHSSTEMWQLYKLGSWIEALPSVSWNICLVSKVAVQNITTWLCKSTPCAYSENRTEREISVPAAMSHTVAGDHTPPHWCAFYIYFKSNIVST